MNAKVKSIARKIPGFGSLIAKMELLEQDIRDCRVQNAVLARENIGLRLKLKKINGEKVNVVFVCLPRVLRGVAPLMFSRSHISFGDGYSVVGRLSPPHKGMIGKGRFYGCRRGIISPSSGRSREGGKTKSSGRKFVEPLTK